MRIINEDLKDKFYVVDPQCIVFHPSGKSFGLKIQRREGDLYPGYSYFPLKYCDASKDDFSGNYRVTIPLWVWKRKNYSYGETVFTGL